MAHSFLPYCLNVATVINAHGKHMTLDTRFLTTLGDQTHSLISLFFFLMNKISYIRLQSKINCTRCNNQIFFKNYIEMCVSINIITIYVYLQD